jgi:hypothetical protein
MSLRIIGNIISRLKFDTRPRRRRAAASSVLFESGQEGAVTLIRSGKRNSIRTQARLSASVVLRIVHVISFCLLHPRLPL